MQAGLQGLLDLVTVLLLFPSAFQEPGFIFRGNPVAGFLAAHPGETGWFL